MIPPAYYYLTHTNEHSLGILKKVARFDIYLINYDLNTLCYYSELRTIHFIVVLN